MAPLVRRPVLPRPTSASSAPRVRTAVLTAVLTAALTAVLAGVLAPAPTPAAAAAVPVGLDAPARPPLQPQVLGRTPTAQPLLTSTAPTGYTPAQVRALLGLTGTGAGQTIAVVTAYDAPNAAKDLALFSSTFGLPAPPSFRKVNQTGGTKMPPVDGWWALEAALDLQWAHAVAPAADLLLVQASSSALGNLLAAVSWAAAQPRVTVVSGSFGAPEFASQKDQDARCRLTTGVCVFASGDNGSPGTYPATNPWALAVGGTTLLLDGAGGVVSETAWSGSGGGVSAYSPKPAYQSGTSAARRTSPDVAYAGDPATGFAVYSSTPYQRQTGWFVMGGTSAGAPQWAGLLAAANGLRKGVGKGPLTATNAAGATPLHSAVYSSAVRSSTSLFDVVSGANGTCGAVCAATAGYDMVTGVGSPRRGLDAVLRDLP